MLRFLQTHCNFSMQCCRLLLETMEVLEVNNTRVDYFHVLEFKRNSVACFLYFSTNIDVANTTECFLSPKSNRNIRRSCGKVFPSKICLKPKAYLKQYIFEERKTMVHESNKRRIIWKICHYLKYVVQQIIGKQ